jgi:uncharacterized protein YuzE
MRITYDPQVDALYIELRDAERAEAVDLDEGVTVDLDEEGHVVGIEILDARLRLGREPRGDVKIERLARTG